MTQPTDHTTDADCAGFLDPEDDVCTVCAVYHGDPCPACGGRGFHTTDDCPVDQEGTP